MLLDQFLFGDASFAFDISQAQTIRSGHYTAFKPGQHFTIQQILMPVGMFKEEITLIAVHKSHLIIHLKLRNMKIYKNVSSLPGLHRSLLANHLNSGAPSKTYKRN